MPQVDGFEAPSVENLARGGRKRHSVDRKAQWLRYYSNTRAKALAAIGGACDCGERNPSQLHIVGLTDEAKEWSQLRFYKRLIEAFKSGDDPSSLGRIVCRACKYSIMAKSTAARRESKKGTGEFYWIAGQRVEQKRLRWGLNYDYKCTFLYNIHEDLGSEEVDE